MQLVCNCNSLNLQAETFKNLLTIKGKFSNYLKDNNDNTFTGVFNENLMQTDSKISLTRHSSTNVFSSTMNETINDE